MTSNILADMVGYWYRQLLIILSHIKGAILEKVQSLNIFWCMDFFFWATLNYTQELEIQLLILPELPSIFLYFPKIQSE